MRRTRLFSLALFTAALAVACSKDKTNTGGTGGGDAGTNTVSDTGIPTDAGIHPDAEPLPCLRDQECGSGEVCNLATDPHECVPGTTCQNDNDCDNCFNLTNPGAQIDCGHGFHIQSYCDDTHGNVCVRDLSACEPCDDDRDCGELHALLGGSDNKCVTYMDGNKYCGRSSSGASCPQGFIGNNDGQCVREVCPARIDPCPEGTAGQACQGTDQICPGVECAGSGGARCSNNDVPGALGVCVHFCQNNGDCPADLPICNAVNGVCIAGCTKDSCAGNQVCHSSGFCGPACDSNGNCEMRFGADTYCNQPGHPPPNIFKGYHDQDSCQPKGCEKAVDCPSAGLVCDDTQQPYPACVPGCYDDTDCLSGEQCKDPGVAGPQGSYSRAECRALARKNSSDGNIGVCCNPGCTNRNLQCGFNQWCCGESDSAYEDPASCGTLTSTGSVMADPGQCFDIAPRPFSPFCVQCQANSDCDSQWLFGYNEDQNINGGQPFQEQEWCQGVAMGLGMCSVTCNPALPEGGNIGCPRLWNCQPFTPPCFQDADCSGLTCVGADAAAMPPRPGQCQCGANGQVSAQCPSVYPNLDTVQNPRCLELGQNGEMFCIASYHCVPPPLTMDGQGNANYPAACLQ